MGGRGGETCSLLEVVDRIRGCCKSVALDPYLMEHLGQNVDGINVGVVGTYSTGKSSWINAWIGVELLPSEAGPTTQTVTVVRHGDGAEMTVVGATGEVEALGLGFPGPAGSEIFHGLMRAFPVDRMDLESKVWSHLLDNLDPPILVEISIPLDRALRSVCLVDTPGINAPDQRSLVVHTILPCLDLVVLVCDFRDAENAHGIDLLKQAKALELPTLVLVNKTDQRKRTEATVELRLEGLRDILRALGLDNVAVHGVCLQPCRDGPRWPTSNSLEGIGALAAELARATSDLEHVRARRLERLRGHLNAVVRNEVPGEGSISDRLHRAQAELEALGEQGRRLQKALQHANDALASMRGVPEDHQVVCELAPVKGLFDRVRDLHNPGFFMRLFGRGLQKQYKVEMAGLVQALNSHVAALLEPWNGQVVDALRGMSMVDAESTGRILTAFHPQLTKDKRLRKRHVEPVLARGFDAMVPLVRARAAAVVAVAAKQGEEVLKVETAALNLASQGKAEALRRVVAWKPIVDDLDAWYAAALQGRLE